MTMVDFFFIPFLYPQLMGGWRGGEASSQIDDLYVWQRQTGLNGEKFPSKCLLSLGLDFRIRIKNVWLMESKALFSTLNGPFCGWFMISIFQDRNDGKKDNFLNNWPKNFINGFQPFCSGMHGFKSHKFNFLLFLSFFRTRCFELDIKIDACWRRQSILMNKIVEERNQTTTISPQRRVRGNPTHTLNIRTHTTKRRGENGNFPSNSHESRRKKKLNIPIEFI